MKIQKQYIITLRHGIEELKNEKYMLEKIGLAKALQETLNKLEDTLETEPIKLCVDCKKPLPKGFVCRCPDCYDTIYFPK